MSSPLLTSISPQPRFGLSLPRHESVPVIVAESLEPVALPLETMLRGMQRGKAADVIGQIARGLARPRDHHAMPGWLQPEQQVACSILLPMLRRHNCALLAEPVGTGKTYVALGVAARWKDPTPVTVLAPAAIVGQWQRTAARVGVPVNLWSHERLSRGSTPPRLGSGPARSLVIIDESHHFRNPGTQRYQHVAPRLNGCAVLLLSATPVVNSLEELAAQLLLGARDDTLLPFGIRSIRSHLTNPGRDSSALGELVLAGRLSPGGRPERIQRKEKTWAKEAGLERRCAMIERLALSANPSTSRLIRSVFWRAMASSDTALLAVLQRYRSLLRQARDAADSGRVLTRAALRSLVGPIADQVVMWELFTLPDSPGDLVLADLDLLDRLISQTRDRSGIPDLKCRRLEALVKDGKPTLVFTGARETVRYLRDQLPGAAWCTGTSAGIGSSRMARDDVLSWFRPGGSPPGGPSMLITTDVSAEGLDLQHAGRVVHYDLPWTAVRIDQRNGRVLRLGSSHDRVEVIRFEPPEPIEKRLGQLGVIARKRRLPRKAGIDAHGSRAWLWRDDIAARFATKGGAGQPLYCSVLSDSAGILAGFSLYAADGASGHRVATVVGFIDADGSWSEEPALVARMMEYAKEAAPAPCSTFESGLGQVREIIRRRTESLELAQWSHHFSPLQCRAIARLNRLATRAVHARKASLLIAVERAIGFARRGHTAGEAVWLENLLALPDPALIREIRQCPEAGPTTPSSYSVLLGVVVFSPAGY